MKMAMACVLVWMWRMGGKVIMLVMGHAYSP
jgi:hypothetical protein